MSWAAVRSSNLRSESFSTTFATVSASSETRIVRSTRGHIVRATWVTALRRSSTGRVGAPPLG